MLVNPKYLDIGASIGIDRKNSHQLKWYQFNDNKFIIIFTTIIFRDTQEIINDLAHINCGTSNPNIEKHGHCLEIIITKRNIEMMLQIINNVYIGIQ